MYLSVKLKLTVACQMTTASLGNQKKKSIIYCNSINIYVLSSALLHTHHHLC